MSLAYESDFNFWIEEQTKLLKEHRFDELDIEHLIEEMEDLGGSYKDSLESHLRNVIIHMLKTKYQPEMSCNSWSSSTANARASIKKIIRKNPSLKKYPQEVLEEAYEEGREVAIKESGLNENVFPIECPWTLEEILG